MIKELIQRLTRKESKAVSLETGLAFLEANGVDVDSLKLPYRKQDFDCEFHRTFEDLRAIPREDKGESVIRISGRYTVQPKGGYRREPIVYNLDVKGKIRLRENK